MKSFLCGLTAVVLALVAFVAGYGFGVARQPAVLPLQLRYQLQPSGVPGLTYRLDRVTGETVVAP